ncbi:hypothetical protein [Sneathiella chinensis]|uniref:DUF945 family protein n=1 Tax=Sneathiella chinensis TaxID=349750 RepID=A0ABQ5U1V7_9PROT|nr:hypothetical protein [Sneathiella chinensis]GLQ05406.1 hypothetical protein GCM10007924_06270 [Sneathiella chinensis]
MNKKFLFAGLGISGLLIAGITGLNHYASGQAKRAVEDALYQWKLDTYIRYETVSHNVLTGATTLSDVTLYHDAFGQVPVDIESARLTGLAFEDEFLTEATVQLSSATLPVLDVARKCSSIRCPARYWSNYILYAGYQNLTVDLSVSFTADLEASSVDLALTGEAPEFGDIAMKVALERTDAARLWETGAPLAANLIQDGNILQTLFRGNMKDLQAVIDSTRIVELAHLEASFTDDGLLDRVFASKELDLLTPAEPDDFREQLATTAQGHMLTVLEKGSIRPSVAESVSEEWKSFLMEGGEISLETRMDRPVRLFQKGGFIGIRPNPELSNPPEFLRRTRLTLEHS